MLRLFLLFATLAGCFALSAAVASAADEPRRIPLQDIHGTMVQKEIKRLSIARDRAGNFIEPYTDDALKLFFELEEVGMAMVPGKDIAAAIKATRGNLPKGENVDQSLVLKQEENAVWLVVYFGADGTGPPAFTIQEVTVENFRIRITYRRAEAMTDDLNKYTAWIPLGKLQSSTYRVETYEVGSKKVVLRRDCKVLVK
jgi:hypothetical protein